MDLPNSLQRALHHLESGAPARCLRVCNEILAGNPGLIHALYLRGCASYETGDMGQSVSDLEIVHANHPEHLQAAYHLGRALRRSARFEDALAPLNLASGEPELAVQARYELANCLAHLRRRPEAIEHYQAILKVQPGNTQVAANLGSLLERENRLDEADVWTCKSLQRDPGNETAQMTRATLDRRDGNTLQAIQRLRELIPGIGNATNRSIAWNQLGQCLESQEEWGEAYDAFTESNRIIKKHHPRAHPDARGPHSLQTLARIQEWLKGRPMAGWTEPATRDAGGIAFLVGFPRSGTTLLDRMLGSHPDIEVLEEKSLFSLIHQDWSDSGTLEALAEISETQICEAREIYRREMARHRTRPQRSLVVDKLPLNLAYLFLIRRLFPEAPIIFLQRHPMDVCISCYFQAFELQASMAYFLDIEKTAQYYDAVMQVASLSTEQIARPPYEMRYEDLVSDAEVQLTELLDFLGLEICDSMLAFWRQNETSNTPSYQQVSQPLYSRSIGKWRHYTNQLQPGLPHLQPWVKRFGYGFGQK